MLIVLRGTHKGQAVVQAYERFCFLQNCLQSIYPLLTQGEICLIASVCPVESSREFKKTVNCTVVMDDPAHRTADGMCTERCVMQLLLPLYHLLWHKIVADFFQLGQGLAFTARFLKFPEVCYIASNP